MAKALNFNNIKKQFLTVTLADDEKTTLLIATPDKRTMSELTVFQDQIESMTDEPDAETMDALYDITARLMSRNKGGKKITKEYLESICFDFEDIMIFFRAYKDFLSEIISSKN